LWAPWVEIIELITASFLGLTCEERQIVGELQIIHRVSIRLVGPITTPIGFGIKGVEVRHAPVHVEVNDALRGGDLFQIEAPDPGGTAEIRERGKGTDAEERLGGTADKMAAGEVELAFMVTSRG
jgi:hypothetical protein